MGNKPVKQHMETAEKTGVLTLCDFDLKELPAQVLHLRAKLRTLNLSTNKLQALPGFVGELASLKQLHVDQNRLEYLPNEMCQLKRLEVFTAGRNHLSEMPPMFADLTGLVQLNLSQNAFTTFPVVVCQLKNLDFLDLSGNQIRMIPNEVRTLNAVELNLNQNQLNAISETAMVDAPRLKVLRVEENCLNLNVFTERLLADSKLTTIAFDGNMFDAKDFRNLPGHETYMERFTATKKKLF